jgi:hypothetical protein
LDNMIAVTLYGTNSQGFPSDYPKSCRENAGSLLPGEDLLFDTPEAYAAYASAKHAAFTPPRPAADVITDIKAEALRRIVALLGYTPDQVIDWTTKEINMNAQASEILRRVVAGTATADDQAALDSMDAIFSKIKAIRSYSNTIGAQVMGGGTPDIYSGWPF